MVVRTVHDLHPSFPLSQRIAGVFKKLLPTELLGIMPDSEWALNQGEPSPSSFSQPRQGTLTIAANTAKSTELRGNSSQVQTYSWGALQGDQVPSACCSLSFDKTDILWDSTFSLLNLHFTHAFLILSPHICIL